MSTELRALGPEDYTAHRLLMSHAFGQGRIPTPPAPDAPAPDMHGIWGVLESGVLKASLQIQDFEVHWGADDTLAMGGIAGVATFAEARGQGYVGQLLRQSLVAMREAGQTISALYPFAWAFYRRYGWDWVGRKLNVKLPTRELKAYPEGKLIEMVEGSVDERREALAPGYVNFARQYRGVFTSGTHRWNSRLSDSDNRATYTYRYPPTGAYLLHRYDGGSSRVREFTGVAPEDYRAALSLLHYLGTQCKEARLALPDDTTLFSYVMHWDIEVHMEPVFQGRVVDFAPALAQVRVAPGTPNGSLTLALNDEYAPWNDGTWRITVESGKVQADLIVGIGVEADIALDIQALSQAYWGTPSLTELRRAGRIEVQNDVAFNLLSQILPSAVVYTLDDF